MDIPSEVVRSVGLILRPYGVNFAELINDKDKSDRKFITPQQASQYCGLSAKTIRDKALSGVIKSIKIGKSKNSRVLIDKADLNNWLESFKA